MLRLFSTNKKKRGFLSSWKNHNHNHYYLLFISYILIIFFFLTNNGILMLELTNLGVSPLFPRNGMGAIPKGSPLNLYSESKVAALLVNRKMSFNLMFGLRSSWSIINSIWFCLVRLVMIIEYQTYNSKVMYNTWHDEKNKIKEHMLRFKCIPIKLTVPN